MKPVEKTAEDLFQKLRNRFSPVEMGDENAEETTDPTKARIFSFMYKDGENEVGFVSISIIANRSFKVYYGTDVTDRVENKNSWYSFLKDLRMFAKRNLMSFDARDLAKNQLEPRDFKFISNQDGTYKDHEVEVSESVMFGSRRKSYQTMENVKMIVNHRKSIDETVPGARSRYIESIYLERADGERYKFPYNYLTGARAMARHVNEGGNPYDDTGKHIIEMIKEMKDLSKFARRTKKYAMEDEQAGNIRNNVVERFHSMKKQLGAMSVKEGYTRFVENFKKEEAMTEDETQQLKERFTQQVFDTQLEDTLPAVMRAIKEAEMRQVVEADKSIVHLIKSKPLVLRKDDSADNMFRSTKFTDGAGLLGFILSDVASRAIGDDADVIANFASDAAERIQDREYDPSDKQTAMMLAKKYMDDVKKMASDPEYGAQVRVDPKEVYGGKKKRTGGFHEAEAFESWANAIVPEDYDKNSKEMSDMAADDSKYYKNLVKTNPYSSYDKQNAQKSKDLKKTSKKFANKAVTGMEEDYEKDAADWSKKYADNEKFARGQAKSTVPLIARISPQWKKDHTKDANSMKAISKKYANKAVTGMDDEKLPESSFYRDGERTGSAEGAKRAILWRIQNQHLDLIKQYGLDAVLQAVDDEAMYLDNLEEIGSSDISAWVNNIKRNLAADYSEVAANTSEAQVDELKPSTLKSYVTKANARGTDHYDRYENERNNRLQGIDRAKDRLGGSMKVKKQYGGKVGEATTTGTIGTATTSGTAGTSPNQNPAQALRDPKLQQNAKNVSRVAQAAGLKTNPNQIAQTMATQAAGKPLTPQGKKTTADLGSTVMNAAASDPKKAAQITAMMKKMTQP